MELILIRMGITGVVSLGLIALQWISLSDVTVLGFLVPLTTAMAGCIFLKEKFSKSQAIAGVLSLVGVILIARPAALFGRVPETTREEEGANAEPEESLPSAEANPSDHLRLLAVLFSLIGVLGSTVALKASLSPVICTRAVGKRAHAMHSLVAFSSQSVIAAAFGMIITRTPLVFPTEWRWGLLLLDIGVMGFIAQLLLNMGLQHEQAGRGTMALYTQVVWTYILEKLYFQTTPSMMSIVGAVIIVGAAVYVALTKEKTPEEEGQEVMQGVTVALERFDHDEEVLEEGAKDEGGGTEVAKNYSEGP
ncbi:hypothetical protein V5O48_013269 [Marasmius crinis-equi]|uniref:EamA domain-containing protein n=1 Tax=Marasmius crinis-equi TaxID=585013 RepID=A0ABR3F0P1_9AGAR